MSTCPECNGKGYTAKHKDGSRTLCWSCHGNGNDTWADFMSLRNATRHNPSPKKDNS